MQALPLMEMRPGIHNISPGGSFLSGIESYTPKPYAGHSEYASSRFLSLIAIVTIVACTPKTLTPKPYSGHAPYPPTPRLLGGPDLYCSSR